jgi:tetratricopeptide (TPR) repeat protein
MFRGKSPILVVLYAALFAAPATRAAWQPFDLGAHHRSVSTRSEEAQRAFDQGLIWSFAFNHEESERAFREAARLDPDLAIAWWGVALVNGPHINNTTVDEVHAKAAWEALGEAKVRLAGASPVERALVEALGTRYAWPQPADRAPLDEAYARAMVSVHARFPSDADVAALAAEALMDVRPWDQWTHDGRPQPGTKEVLRALEEARALDPKHPGALHLTIHALESSPHPERAKTAADGLRRLVRDASHLLHMPAHIDVRLGLWKQAAEANERAIEADARYSARTPEMGFYRIYQAHNTHFLAYTAMMEGRRRVALETTAAVVSAFPPAFVKENAMFADAFMTVHGEALKRFGMWEEILALPAPDPALPVSTAYAHVLRGTAHAALGHMEEARAERQAFEKALANVPREFLWGSNTAAAVLAVLGPYLEGEIAFRAGDRTRAIARLREAVGREDALKYDEPPPMTVPSRHALGAVLLAAGRPKEAEAVYREDLRRYPANGWALLGLSRALRAQGRTAESAAALARRRRAWARADVEVTSSCLCVPGT